MNVEIASTMKARLRGLLGRKSFDGLLLLVPCNDVHTFWMGAPIDIAFLAADGVVVESHRAVGPWRRLRNRRAAVVVERFASSDSWFEVGVRLRFCAACGECGSDPGWITGHSNEMLDGDGQDEDRRTR